MPKDKKDENGNGDNGKGHGKKDDFVLIDWTEPNGQPAELAVRPDDVVSLATIDTGNTAVRIRGDANVTRVVRPLSEILEIVS